MWNAIRCKNGYNNGIIIINTQQKDNHELIFHILKAIIYSVSLISIFYLQIMSILRHQHRPHFRSVA